MEGEILGYGVEFNWLGKLEQGKLKVPKAAFDTIHTLKEGSLVLVHVEVVGKIVE